MKPVDPPIRHVMKQALRKTASHLHLAYRHGEAGGSMLGRNFMLGVQGRVMTLDIDLTGNFHTRKKSASPYLGVVGLAQHHEHLRFVQCSDNLVRARLIKAWEGVENPQLRMCLDLGASGCYLYSVQPHSLFTGGVQLDVIEPLDETTQPGRVAASSHLHRMA